MRVVQNRLLPPRPFLAINLLGTIFVRKGTKPGRVMLNHERIHTAQMRELGYVGFYLAYLVEWVIRLLLPGNAYRNISFEREAYRHEADLGYLSLRRRFAQWR